jgi:hypothetical protein
MAESKPSKPIRIAPTGIRLIGAIFCGDEMDLSDLNLSYPLVLDHALFRFGVRGDNFRTRGNFSLDGSYVFDNLALNASRIGGSLFARGGYFENVGLSETEVRGSIHFDHSLLDRTALFDRVSAAGDISLSNTALSRVRVHQSNVKGRLELDQSEARCGYSVRGSDIDEIWATNLGFGTVSKSEDISPAAASQPSTAQRGPPLPPVFRYGWSRSQEKDFYKSLMQNASIKAKTDAAQPCETPPIEIAPELLVLDVRARSVCLQSFHWLTSSDSDLQPRSSIILSEVKIAGSMNVNLFPQNASPAQVLPSQRTMRIEGLNVGCFFSTSATIIIPIKPRSIACRSSAFTTAPAWIAASMRPKRIPSFRTPATSPAGCGKTARSPCSRSRPSSAHSRMPAPIRPNSRSPRQRSNSTVPFRTAITPPPARGGPKPCRRFCGKTVSAL